MWTSDRPDRAWISEAERLQLNAKKAHRVGDRHPVPEHDHFYVCETCGQAVDMRLLGDVLYHEQMEHVPLPRH